jgi:hypothetical protein
MVVRDAMSDYVKKVNREVELEQEINDGYFLDLKAINKMLTPRAVQIGTVGELLKTEKKKKSKPFLDEIDEVNFRSVLVAKAVEDAVKKARMLRMQKKDVRKNIVEKPRVSELPLIALHGNLNKVMTRWSAMRRLVNAEC